MVRISLQLLGKSWHATELFLQSLDDTFESKPLSLFIHAENIYLSPKAFASMVLSYQTAPQYSIVQANMVKQQVLAWLHMKLGTARPYQPEVAGGRPESDHGANPMDAGSDHQALYELLTETGPDYKRKPLTND